MLQSVKLLIMAHICISFGGLLIHLRLHPLGQSLYFWWAVPVVAFSVIVLPFLFARRSTVGWGYMLNAGTVLIGLVGMAYFSVLKADWPMTLSFIFRESTMPYMFILLAKLAIAHVILVEIRSQGIRREERGCSE
jgi:hypothetical protein